MIFPPSGNQPSGEVPLLLIEDDRDTAGMLAELFGVEGYQTDVAHDGHRGLHLGLSRRHQVIVVDRLIPGIDGLDLVRRLRRVGVTSRVLMLTALGGLEDRVTGLDSGADDYLVKPFEVDELLARVRALCRRDLDGAEMLPLGTGSLDSRRRTACLANGAVIVLSAREFDLLRTLAADPKAAHDRSRLREKVFPDTSAESIVDTYVYYLRRKLGRQVVRTVHGLGYQVGTL
jgi:DNA-binding response OmpR family regulator